MKKNDWIFIAAVLVFGMLFWRLQYLGKESGEGTVVIKVDGETYGEYSLKKEQTIKINDTNRIAVKEGHVEMVDANCPDQICVHHKAISRTGESIICLPNQVVLSIEDGKDAKLDAVAN